MTYTDFSNAQLWRNGPNLLEVSDWVCVVSCPIIPRLNINSYW